MCVRTETMAAFDNVSAWVRHCADAVEALPSPRRAKVELLAGMAVLGGLVLESAVLDPT